MIYLSLKLIRLGVWRDTARRENFAIPISSDRFASHLRIAVTVLNETRNGSRTKEAHFLETRVAELGKTTSSSRLILLVYLLSENSERNKAKEIVKSSRFRDKWILFRFEEILDIRTSS